MMRMAVRRRDRLAALIVAGVALLGVTGGLGACTIVRNGLGTRVSVCFKSLPAANTAVHAAGRFAGMRYTTIGDLEDYLRHSPGGVVVAPPGALQLPRRTGVCVVAFHAYHGRFAAGAVLDGWAPTGNADGRYAMVIVRQSDLHVLATAVTEHEPAGFVRIYPRL